MRYCRVDEDDPFQLDGRFVCGVNENDMMVTDVTQVREMRQAAFDKVDENLKKVCVERVFYIWNEHVCICNE